jgi:hypothetical protein
MIESVFDIPGCWVMDDYGTMQRIEFWYGPCHFHSLQPNWRYHC